jgi:hypothetical protein
MGKGAGWRRVQLCGPEIGLKSSEPIGLKKLGAAREVLRSGVHPSARKMPFVGGHVQR